MPKARLIKSVVDKLPYSKSGPICYFDEQLPGFGVRVGKTKKTFFVQRDIYGKTKLRTIGQYGIWTPEQAREEAREKLYFMSKGIDPDEEQRKKKAAAISLDDLAQEFFKARKSMKPRTKDDYQYHMVVDEEQKIPGASRGAAIDRLRKNYRATGRPPP